MRFKNTRICRLWTQLTINTEQHHLANITWPCDDLAFIDPTVLWLHFANVKVPLERVLLMSHIKSAISDVSVFSYCQWVRIWCSPPDNLLRTKIHHHYLRRRYRHRHHSHHHRHSNSHHYHRRHHLICIHNISVSWKILSLWECYYHNYYRHCVACANSFFIHELSNIVV